MDQNPLTLLPARARQAIYIVYGVLALVGVGVTAYYGAVPSLTVPDYVTGGLAVLGALAAPIGVLAATNTHPDDGRGLSARPSPASGAP